MSTTSVVPPYFELCWSVLSTIGAANVVFGLIVVGITTFSQTTLVPIISAAAGALANGLCYYAFYNETYSVKTKAIASAFGDVFWMVQEVSLSFYSYVLLRRVLKHRKWFKYRKWLAFCGPFWAIFYAIAALRVMIAVSRVRFVLGGNTAGLQRTQNNLHVAYFALVASLEYLGIFFLLTTSFQTKPKPRPRPMLHLTRETAAVAVAAEKNGGLCRYLACSTEVRIASLAVLGTVRACTYPFQTTARSSDNAASQLDRFAYTLECLFPTVLLIDVLASRIVFTTTTMTTSKTTREAYKATGPYSPGLRVFTSGRRPDNWSSSSSSATPYSQRVVEVCGGKWSSSGEDMVSLYPARSSDVDLKNAKIESPRGISKKVAFSVWHSDELTQLEKPPQCFTSP